MRTAKSSTKSTRPARVQPVRLDLNITSDSLHALVAAARARKTTVGELIDGFASVLATTPRVTRFIATDENEVLLQRGEALGMTRGEIVNECLRRHLTAMLEARKGAK